MEELLDFLLLPGYPSARSPGWWREANRGAAAVPVTWRAPARLTVAGNECGRRGGGGREGNPM